MSETLVPSCWTSQRPVMVSDDRQHEKQSQRNFKGRRMSFNIDPRSRTGKYVFHWFSGIYELMTALSLSFRSPGSRYRSSQLFCHFFLIVRACVCEWLHILIYVIPTFPQHVFPWHWSVLWVRVQSRRREHRSSVLSKQVAFWIIEQNIISTW